MIERIRALLDRPLDPRHARAVVIVASCLTVAFAILVALGVIGSRPGSPDRDVSATPVLPTAPRSPVTGDRSVGRTGRTRPAPRPAGSHGHSDVYPSRGESAGRGVHGLLGHLPYLRGPVRIELAGRRKGTVVLRVTARTRRAARGAWQRFLRRFGDDGSAYRPLFRGRRKARHG